LQIKRAQTFYIKYLLTIIAIVGGYLVLVVFDNYTNHQHRTLCFFKLVTGIPCPGCGMGRATLEIFKGNVISSFRYNILCVPFTFTIIVSFIWLCADIIKKKETFFSFIQQDIKTPYKISLFVLLIITWIINIVRQV